MTTSQPQTILTICDDLDAAYASWGGWSGIPGATKRIREALVAAPPSLTPQTRQQYVASKALAHFVLRNAASFRWELQGFGMLRCYLPGDVRLQVWDTTFAVNSVTSIHDHPWRFDSLIVAGNLFNERFIETKDQPPTHMKRTIVPGIGLRRVGGGEDEPVRLVSSGVEQYGSGDIYHQEADEIHESNPARGTVTIISRQRVGADVARSYYPAGTEWVSAEPRIATDAERDAIIGFALKQWFDDAAPPAQAPQEQATEKDISGVPHGSWGGLSPKQAWWAGYRVGKCLPADMPRSQAVAAEYGGQPPFSSRTQPLTVVTVGRDEESGDRTITWELDTMDSLPLGKHALFSIPQGEAQASPAADARYGEAEAPAGCEVIWTPADEARLDDSIAKLYKGTARDVASPAAEPARQEGEARPLSMSAIDEIIRTLNAKLMVAGGPGWGRVEFAHAVQHYVLASPPPAAAGAQPVAYRLDWPPEYGVGARRFMGADDPALQRERADGIAKLVPLYAAAPRAVPIDAQADTERLDWLIENSATYSSPKVPIQLVVQEGADVHRTHGGVGYRKGLRAAVDAARAAGKESSNG